MAHALQHGFLSWSAARLDDRPPLLMAETRDYLGALAASHIEVPEILARTNRFLCDETKGSHFVTLVFAKIDPHDCSLTHAAAGHRGHLLRASGIVERLASKNIPLGIDSEAGYACEAPHTLHSGDLLLLVTDGVFETRAPDDTLFGVSNRLKPCKRDLAATVFIDAVLAIREQFRGMQFALVV